MSRASLPGSIWGRGLVCILGFGVLQLLFFALLTAGAAVPDRPIVRHLALDVKAKVYGPSNLKDRMGGKSDSFTECVVVGTGLGGTISNPVDKAAQMPRISNCKVGADQILRLDAGQPAGATGFYFRYWAGYTPLTRPVLALWGITGVRLVSGALLLATMLLAAGALSRTVGRLGALALLGPLVLSTNVMSTPSTSFSQALSISAYLAGVALVAWSGRRSVGFGLTAVVIAAAVFCYVDLLTTPSIGWALSAATLTGVTYIRTQSLRSTLMAAFGSGVLWPFAFAFTWVSRWVLALPFAGWSAVSEDVQTSILFRSDGEYAGVKHELWAATLKNWHYWLDHMATGHVVVVVSLVVAVVGAVGSLRRGMHGLAAVLVVALPAAVVPFWYEALRNHSQIHSFFVYRGVPVAFGILMFAGVIGLRVARADWPRDQEVSTASEPAMTSPPNSTLLPTP